MRWFSHRARVVLFAVVAFLALTVVVMGVVRVVNPELNLMELIGFSDDEKPTVSPTEPYWRQLTESQKEALAPLERIWDQVSPDRKKKWLEIAHQMETMPPEEKKRLQERIRVWANLTPQERKEARKNYLSTKKLGVKDKSSQWEKYQNLPEEEKTKLAETARKKRLVVPSRSRKEEEKKQPDSGKETGSGAKNAVPDYWR